MVRLYQWKSEKQTLLVGFLIELQVFIISIPESLILFHSFNPFLLPIPLSLLIAFLVVKNAPPERRDISWVEKEQGKAKWWNPETNKEPETRWSRARTQLLSVANLNKILGLALVAEIVILIIGGLIATILDSYPLRACYGQSVPWFILITGLLFLMIYPMKIE
jgi:hypothetical protein